MSNFYFPVRRLCSHISLTLLLCCFAAWSNGQPTISYNAVINGLSSPLDFVNAGDNTNRIFIVQQGGTIRVYDQTFNYLGDFLTVAGISSGSERGLLSMAFHPDYKNNGFFYVYYTNSNGDVEVARYHVSAGDPNAADPASKSIVITIPHPGQANHNGGKLNFGADGYLYFGTGDGGGGGDVPNNAQNGNSLLGKMIRIAVNTSATAPFYTIPPDNPYISDPNVLDEVYDIGLRNPFRWSFDRLTHDMWIGDVGQDLVEEIDYRAAASTAAVNYGWRCYEGNQTYNTAGCGPISNYVFPVFTYLHTGTAAVSGGMVYRGSQYPDIAGFYFASDVYTNTLYIIRPDGSGGWITSTQSGLASTIVGYGETENGELYTVSLNGIVYRLQSTALVPLRLVNWQAQWVNSAVQLQWQTAFEQNLRQFDIEYSTDGNHFLPVTSVAATNLPNGYTYHYQHNINTIPAIYYRLKIIDLNGAAEYSKVILVNKQSSAANRIYPTVIDNGIMNINLSESFQNINMYTTDGKQVFDYNLGGRTGLVTVQLPSLIAGTYVVQLVSSGRKLVQKIIVK